MVQNKNTWVYIDGSGLGRTHDFQKFWGPGLDRIKFLRIRIGLGQKILTVRSSLGCSRLLDFSVNGRDAEAVEAVFFFWFIVSYDSANKQKHHKSHRMQ